MNTEKTLTFQDGKFYLCAPHFKTQLLLQDAAKLKTIADPIARSVLDRCLFKKHNHSRLTHIDIPFLDPHQLDGVNWILSRNRSYLAHAPGAGKTSQSIIAACLSPFIGPTVIIVPPTLTKNWEREILKFTDLLLKGRSVSPKLFNIVSYPTISIVPSTEKKKYMGWRSDFIIVPDSMLAKSWVYTNLKKLPIKFLCVDEASRFKEADSERSQIFYGGINHPGLFQGVPHVVFLDGSPMPNRHMELWAPLRALHPESINFMTRHEFGLKFCGAKIGFRGQWEYKGSTNDQELKSILRTDLMHVVSEDVLNHPDRLRSMLVMNKDVRSLDQKTWEQKHLKDLKPSEIDESLSQGDLATFRREIGIQKIAWTARYIGERLKSKNESILLFAWHREVCEGLFKALKIFNPGIIIGGTTNDSRETSIKEFQEGKSRLIISNISAGGRGHNLQKADRVVFCEFSWTDEYNIQAEKRASRRGRDQEKSVRCEYIVVPGSIDEMVLNAVFTKEKRVRKIMS